MLGACDRPEFSDGLVEWGFRIEVGLQKAGIRGGLIAAEPGLLVENELLDKRGDRDPLVGLFNHSDGGVRSLDLPNEDAGEDEARDNGNDQDLSKRSFEPYELQAFSSLFQVIAVRRWSRLRVRYVWGGEHVSQLIQQCGGSLSFGHVDIDEGTDFVGETNIGGE